MTNPNMSQFLEICPPDLPLNACAAQLLASPLADRRVLLEFYSKETLMSTAARAGWVEPDLAPLRLSLALGDAARTSPEYS